jgi:hypothetical protein
MAKQAKNRGSDAGRGGVVPPVETRWKPGESGNPNGRPNGAATSFERVLEQELERQVPGDSSLGDESRICRRRRLVRALLDAVERGDSWAVRLAFERVWPMTPDGGPVRPVFVVIDEQDLECV